MLNLEHPTACNTNDPAIWFDVQHQALARSLCSACPMRPECLASTLETEELMGTRLQGIHAGLSPSEREHLSINRK